MREISVNSKMVQPSRWSPLSRDTWRRLQECADPLNRDQLPPVILIDMYDHEGEWRACLFDGNHRVALTEKHGGFVSGLLYSTQEILDGEGSEYGLHDGVFEIVRQVARMARDSGIKEWRDLVPDN